MKILPDVCGFSLAVVGVTGGRPLSYLKTFVLSLSNDILKPPLCFFASL
jgi:hypothetical protein